MIEDLRKVLIVAGERAGVLIVVIATDGDRLMDKRRERVLESYSDRLRSMSLDEMVVHLEQHCTVFPAFPNRNCLHLVKNLRQRVRHHSGRPSFGRADDDDA
jgi:hypothetical protein